MENCLFCKIIEGSIPSAKVYEDETVFAFRDIAPQAPVHVLVVPKKHVTSIADPAADPALLGACLAACRTIAEQEGLTADGFRVVSNCGDNACQSVHHLHFHVLGGRKMGEQMA